MVCGLDHTIARELVERAFELAHQWPQSAMILAQEIEHFLRLGGLSHAKPQRA